MAEPATILAVDIGTSSTKGLLIDACGSILASHQVGYLLSSPKVERAEQDPGEILAAVREVIEEIAPSGVDLVLGCAMHSLICVDDQGVALSPMMTWADRRATAVAKRLRDGPAAGGLHARTGTPLHPMSPLCKIRYLADHDRELFDRTARFVSIKEFVTEALTGDRCVDHSVASSSGLLDVARLQWDDEALELAGIDADRLSPLVPTTHVLDDAEHDRRVVIGATDGVLANLGAGVDQLCLTLGTSGAARLVVDRPATDPTGRLFCYVLDRDRWVVGGALNNGGLVLRWLQETGPGAGRDNAALVELASTVPPGADGLVVVPSVTGERFPSYDPDAAPRVEGHEPGRHGDAHFVRATLEGMMLPFAVLLDEVEQAGGRKFDEVRIGGGVFEWAFCRQLLSDVVGRRVAMSRSRESSALGGARLGFAALDVEHGWEDETVFVHEPDSANHALYRELRLGREDLRAQP